MTTTFGENGLEIDLLDPSEPFEVREGTISRCVNPQCAGETRGEIHGEFWLKRTLYRQWMNCSCSVCNRAWPELIEVYDEGSETYVLQDYLTIYDTTFGHTYRWPGFTRSILPLMQAAQKDGCEPGVVVQDVVNRMMKMGRREHLKRMHSTEPGES